MISRKSGISIMREFDALTDYPEPNSPRLVSRKLRTINHRIIASKRGQEFYDGARDSGYGGYHYDGRWIPIANRMRHEYKLNSESDILQVGSEKGFLLHDFLEVVPGIRVNGTEQSKYARDNTLQEVKPFVVDAPYEKLPFADNQFHLVIALGPVYTLNLEGAIQCLSEIERVSRGASFVTLGSYTNEDDYWLFKQWSLLGSTILTPQEWIAVLGHVGYTGDYKFTGAASLKLAWSPDA